MAMPGRRRARSGRRQFSALAVAVAGCFLLTLNSLTTLFAIGTARPGARSQLTQRFQGATATAEAPTDTGRIEYSGIINPKLRNLLNAKEYSAFIDLVNKMEVEGVLDEFLRNSLDYFQKTDIFKIAEKEREKGGDKEIIKQVRADWPTIWPNKMESMRTQSFDVFIKFWNRLGTSKLFDLVLGDVLPDMRKSAKDRGIDADGAALMKMTADEREEEINRRLLASDIVKQLAFLTQDDPRVSRYGEQFEEFMVDILTEFEQKIVLQTEVLEDWITTSVVGVCLFFFYMSLAFSKIVPNPFEIFEEFAPAPELPAIQRTEEVNSRKFFLEIAPEERARQEAAGEGLEVPSITNKMSKAAYTERVGE